MNFDEIGTQYLVLVFVYVVIIAYAIYEWQVSEKYTENGHYLLFFGENVDKFLM